MKSSQVRAAVAAFLFSGVLFCQTVQAQGGQGTGNGGDGIGIEVKAIAKALHQMLEKDAKAQVRKYPEVDPGKFGETISNLVVKAADLRLYDDLDDQKTATNRREGGIPIVRVDIPAYKLLATLTRQILVFHEVLGLMGLEKSNQDHISGRLDALVGRPAYGACIATGHGRSCTVGIRFDAATRSLEGAYDCQSQDGVVKYTGGALKPEGMEFKLVRVWWKGYQAMTDGFKYKAGLVEFEVALPPTSGDPTDFTLIETIPRLSKKYTYKTLNGSCHLVYE